MDFQPNAEQQALQEGIRSFCEGRLTLETLRDLEAKGGFEAALWQELSELGVFGLRRAESHGGLGLGASEACLVFEELGRRLCPGPLAWTVLARDLVAGASEGRSIVGGLDLASASPEPLLVEHLTSLDLLLALRADGVFVIEPAVLDAEPIATPLDPLTPVHVVRELPRGERTGDAEAARALRVEGLGLLAAQLLGIAEATLEIALAYAKEREQFGRPIGSFQAIKHMLADMFARQELARAGVYAAAATLDHPEAGDPEQAARGAKLVAGEAAMKNARACIQIHGGMGYTWEVLDHYYLKRCWVLGTGFGDGEEHADWLALAIAAGSRNDRETRHVG